MPVPVRVAHGRRLRPHVSKRSVVEGEFQKNAEGERSSPPLLPLLLHPACRAVEERYEDDGGGALPLLRRSQVVLSVLLVGVAVCLLGLLLHKRERR